LRSIISVSLKEVIQRVAQFIVADIEII